MWHVGAVHHFWDAIVAGGLADPALVDRPTRPDPADLQEWFEGTAARLAATLGAADPEQPNWTWAPDQTAGFAQRRMAQETAVHRWDAERAVGEAVPIESELAADGIDEWVEHFMPDGPPLTTRIALATTDTTGRWVVGPGEAAMAVIAAPASHLLLALWRRVPLSAVTVEGDTTAAAAFLAQTELD